MFLVLRDLGITNIEVIDRTPSASRFLGMPVKNVEVIDAEVYVKILVA